MAVQGYFNYSSVVGMFVHLAGHLRPDIGYVVNYTACYMFCLVHSCKEALKRIGRYLKVIRDRCLVLNPTSNVLEIICYPDTDFERLYGHNNPIDPTSVRSWTGYVTTVVICPVLWQSKLQIEMALSTMETEIVTLVHNCRDFFPSCAWCHLLDLL